MAASPNNLLSETKILDSATQNPQYNGQDSTQVDPQPLHEAIPQSDPQSTIDANPGEKRKREDQVSNMNSSTHPQWKTSLCSYFRRQDGSCSHGSTCRYAHGEEELLLRPDNTWDPTSERAKKAIKGENGEQLEAKQEEEQEVIMTEMVMDGEDGEECGDPQLSKCLVHLPRKWHADSLRKFLSEQGITFKSAKKKKGMVVGFVSFESVEQLKSAVEVLEGKTFGNKSLKVANIIPRSFERKVKSAMAAQTSEDALVKVNASVSNASNEVQDGVPIDDGSAHDDSTSKVKSARDAVTPLAHMPYIDQLELKKNSVMQMLKKLTRNARKACPSGVSLPDWVLKSKERGGLPCELEGIIESPIVHGYRNKCEFSVGYSRQGKPTVGFMLGNFREGVTAVEEPVDCPNVSKIACKYASILQEFLQHSSLPIWSRFKNTGFWRQLTVREGRSVGKVADENFESNISEVMLIVQVCSVGIDDAQVTSEFERLAQAFAEGAATNSPPLPLTVFVVQDHQGISNVAPTDAPLRSIPILQTENSRGPETANNVVEARIHECISNLRFSISPTAFFQVNTLAAEKLYSLAGEWAGLGPDTLLFDVCCGTGTIGLTLAHRVGMVVGIEMNASAVQDAYKNAEINGIKNCRFICSKAEDVIGSLMKEYLNVSEEQDRLSSALESSEKGTLSCEEKDLCTTNAHNDGESSCQEPENCSSENNGKELQNQLQESSMSTDGNSLVQQFKNVVAIVDPPRMGLHPTVVKALRTHARLRRLVYISCNPESLVANAIELCTPPPEKVEKGKKDNRGWRNMSSAGLARHRAKSMPISEPFQPVKTMAVDLFPHTPHCEMVMLLER
ncbi:Zinc finger CCCH domain-containing protein 24 [Hibiscus syriacus]|uniref:Zinc finger CCCH domain-containing protein 24 n=1 Tax=Hibiscus syriacus TaxID=106335 RepID=A0A6A2ZA23_HIBSY|nr:zinc finger CCCH domain-containing protein 24-like [Hibiscus syriacus]KAE8688841.1 Zinc finger CCCH domain-containing protein 24 [Hibiscus syriacus]